MPEHEPKRPLGADLSAFQQAEELRQLRVLAGATTIAGVAGDGHEPLWRVPRPRPTQTYWPPGSSDRVVREPHDRSGDLRLRRDPGRRRAYVRDADRTREPQASRVGRPPHRFRYRYPPRCELRSLWLRGLSRVRRGCGGRYRGACRVHRDGRRRVGGRGGDARGGCWRGDQASRTPAVRGWLAGRTEQSDIRRPRELRRIRRRKRRRKSMSVGLRRPVGLRGVVRFRRHSDERIRPSRGRYRSVHGVRRLRRRMSAGPVRADAARSPADRAVQEPARRRRGGSDLCAVACTACGRCAVDAAAGRHRDAERSGRRRLRSESTTPDTRGDPACPTGAIGWVEGAAVRLEPETAAGSEMS